MTPKFHRRFIKQYRKLPKTHQEKCDARLLIFEKNSSDPMLRNHALTGKYLGYRSIDITGSLRAIYRLLDQDIAYFIAVDTHPNLYK
ncbi:MAG: type II toxin-antitoxin system mRNA interferase toxin, RelE/StbE family [Candidatus Sungbacteria bacterium]|nr:type II toxin-antitoxin system mRNA interferase toxin, RelE/StbE family [Candidatus Sungbacteria bacterium]